MQEFYLSETGRHGLAPWLGILLLLFTCFVFTWASGTFDDSKYSPYPDPECSEGGWPEVSSSFWGKSTALLSMHPDLAAVSLDTDRSLGVSGTRLPGLHLKGRCLSPARDSQPLPSRHSLPADAATTHPPRINHLVIAFYCPRV